MYNLTAPNPEFSGFIGPVRFSKGAAQTSNLRVVSYCREAGYKVEEIIETPEKEPAKAPVKRKPDKKGSK